MPRAIFVFVVVALAILLLAPPLLLYAAITHNTDPLYRVGVFCAGLALRLGGVRIEVCGKEKIPSNCPVVFMANHQSNADPPAIFSSLPPVLVLVKKEAFRVPVFGRAMRMRGFIPIDRHNRETAKQAVDEASKALGAGHSFVVFAEGTRSPDGRLQPFKKGGFVMALKAGAPILPVSISGGRKIMRKGHWAIHSGPMRITLHDPIPTRNRLLGDGIMDEVRRALLQGLEEDEWPIEELDNRPS